MADSLAPEALSTESQNNNVIFWSNWGENNCDCYDLYISYFYDFKIFKILICIIMNYYVVYISVPN